MHVLAGRGQVISPPQVPDATHAHVVLQSVVCVPQRPHACVPVVPGMHTPSPVHAPSTQRREALHVRVREPHIPHGAVIVAPGVHSSISHVPASNTHASLHVSARDCPAAQPASVRVTSPGEQGPSPVHVPLESHAQATVQRAIRVPQSPQGTGLVEPGTQTPVSVQTP